MKIYQIFLKGLPTKSDIQRNSFKLIDFVSSNLDKKLWLSLKIFQNKLFPEETVFVSKNIIVLS